MGDIPRCLQWAGSAEQLEIPRLRFASLGMTNSFDAPLQKTLIFTLKDLADLAGGELLGDPAQKITGAASLDEAIGGEVSFFGNPKYIAQLRKTRASAVFVPIDFSEQIAAAQIR